MRRSIAATRLVAAVTLLSADVAAAVNESLAPAVGAGSVLQVLLGLVIVLGIRALASPRARIVLLAATPFLGLLVLHQHAAVIEADRRDAETATHV